MKSYLGVSHLDYPNDPDGFSRALLKGDLLPLIGFFIPIGSMLLTRGFDITWVKGVSPPLWYGAILVVSGFGFTFFYPWSMNLMTRLRKKLKVGDDTALSEMMQYTYIENKSEVWSLYYKTCYVGSITVFLKVMTMGWGVSSIIYFTIGLK